MPRKGIEPSPARSKRSEEAPLKLRQAATKRHMTPQLVRYWPSTLKRPEGAGWRGSGQRPVAWASFASPYGSTATRHGRAIECEYPLIPRITDKDNLSRHKD